MESTPLRPPEQRRGCDVSQPAREVPLLLDHAPVFEVLDVVEIEYHRRARCPGASQRSHGSQTVGQDYVRTPLEAVLESPHLSIAGRLHREFLRIETERTISNAPHGKREDLVGWKLLGMIEPGTRQKRDVGIPVLRQTTLPPGSRNR